ncbi:MAG TPA: DJ-1/PfpI family protein [Candidatus Bilamarchaeaceae archaeon]|nr:DJ-1/PfpI family protein [Candidatus Bilamarchaeaceae archaeon]
MAGKRLVMIIAPENFRDEEFSVPAGHFASKGITVEVASTRKGKCTGMMGTRADAKLSLQEVKAADFGGVVFVGGPGTPVVRASPESVRIAREFASAGRVVAAICWAPTILAKAGVLDGKKATVWPGHDPEYGMDTGKVLERFGAQYTGEPVAVDGKFITADGPGSAKRFAEEIERRL